MYLQTVFLALLTAQDKWMISESPANDTVPELLKCTECAMVDDKAENPGRIQAYWCPYLCKTLHMYME